MMNLTMHLLFKGGGKNVNVMSSIFKPKKGTRELQNYKETTKCIQDIIASKTYQSDVLKRGTTDDLGNVVASFPSLELDFPFAYPI